MAQYYILNELHFLLITKIPFLIIQFLQYLKLKIYYY